MEWLAPQGRTRTLNIPNFRGGSILGKSGWLIEVDGQCGQLFDDVQRIATSLLNTLEPFKMPLLKLCWRKPVIKSVTGLRIVKHLDVVENALPGAIPSCISLVFDAFTLQELKNLSATALP